MQILKRAKSGGEVVSFAENEANVREEVLRRTAAAGYSTRNGEPRGSTKIMGSCNFGKRKFNIWPRDANGNLIED